MKLRRFVSTLTLGFVIASMTAVPALAENSHYVKLYHMETVGTASLQPGQYKIQWETHSPEATVTFFQGEKVVGTFKGKIVKSDKKHPSDAVVDETRADGTRVLQEIWLGGTKQSIVFTP